MNNTNAIPELYDKYSKASPELNLVDNVLCQNTRNNNGTEKERKSKSICIDNTL